MIDIYMCPKQQQAVSNKSIMVPSAKKCNEKRLHRKFWKTTHFHENPQNIPSHVFDKKVYRLMGYDSEKREIKMGMLAEKTHPYIRDKVTIIQILTDFS